MVPWFLNLFDYKSFGSQTEVFSKILFLFASSASGDKNTCDHLSHISTNVTMFFKIVEQSKFVNQNTAVLAITIPNIEIELGFIKLPLGFALSYFIF